MHPLTQLDAVISANLLPLLQRHGWTEVRHGESSGHAFRDYVSGNIYIRIINDRGLLEMEIGSGGGNDLRNVSFYKDLLNPPEMGHWNLSFEQQCEFLEQHWIRLNERLSQKNASRTVHEVDENARVRK